MYKYNLDKSNPTVHLIACRTLLEQNSMKNYSSDIDIKYHMLDHLFHTQSFS